MNDQRFNTSAWYISRDNASPQTHHKSEMEIESLSEIEGVVRISNNSSLEDLYGKVATALELYRKV
jgi:hypothetical protein